MLLAIRCMSLKKRKGWTLAEIGVALLVITILVTAGFFVWNIYLDRSRITVAKMEADQLAKACVLYEMDSLTGKPPTDLGQLVSGITAANTIDGVARKPYVVKDTWTTTASSIKDPWGVAYTYSSTNRTISFKMPDGTTATKSF